MNKYDECVTWITYEKETIPGILWAISETWRELTDLTDDKGPCVLGAGFLIKYKGNWYFMPPRGKWQGCYSWEKHLDFINPLLVQAGVSHLFYHDGTLD